MNRITIVGNVGADPTLRTTTNSQVLSFNVADTHWRTKATTWFKVEMWGARGERISEIVKKGMKVTVIGEMRSEEYEAKTGEKRTSLVVNADEIEFENPRHAQAEGGQQPIKQAAVIDTPPATPGAPEVDKEIPF